MAYTGNWSLCITSLKGVIVDTKAKCFDVPALGLMERANLDWGLADGPDVCFLCMGDPLFVRVDIFPLFPWSLIVHAFSHTHSWCFINSLSLMMAVSTIHKIINQIIWKL